MKNISLYVDRKGTIFHTLKTKRELCLLESGLNLFWQKSVNLKWISLCVWGITRSRLCNYINEQERAGLCDALHYSRSAAGERGLSSWPQRDTGFRFSGKQNLLGLHYRTGKTRFGGDDGLDSPVFSSRSETLEEPPVPSGWLRETSSFVQTGEFRQPYAIIVGDDSMAPEIMPGGNIA